MLQRSDIAAAHPTSPAKYTVQTTKSAITTNFYTSLLWSCGKSFWQCEFFFHDDVNMSGLIYTSQP